MDRDLARRLYRLGMDQESLGALLLLPLIEVAWADGCVQLEEQRRIAVFAQSIELGDEAMLFVRSWLRHRPTEAYAERGRHALADLLMQGAPQLGPFDADKLLAEAEAVAQASGSWLPFLRVSAEERAAIARLQHALADTTVHEAHVIDAHPDLDRAVNPVTLDFDARESDPGGFGGVLIPDFLRGGRYPIPATGLVIGRAEGCDIRVLDYAPIQPVHCRVNARGGRYYVQEMEGETRVNGERVLERRLLGGETVRLADSCAFAFKRVRHVAEPLG